MAAEAGLWGGESGSPLYSLYGREDFEGGLGCQILESVSLALQW